jgi:hypothetical protein
VRARQPIVDVLHLPIPHFAVAVAVATELNWFRIGVDVTAMMCPWRPTWATPTRSATSGT